jgi:peptidoglycan/xylan/chitin deacetylase (PgdA/CDA1 family)
VVDPLIPVRIASVGDRPRAAWAEGQTVRWPASLLERTGWRRRIDAAGDLRIPAGTAQVAVADVQALRERCAFTERPPASARLPVDYRAVPGWARALIATAIGRWNRRRADRWAAFPAWPIDVSADVLDDVRVGGDAPAHPAPVVVTHDIDSAEGLTNLCDRFLPLEEALGVRSTSYVIPCAEPLDEACLCDVVARGHELGVHGYDHSNRTPFADAVDRARRLDAGRAFADRYGAVGYRAPSLLRTRALLRDVGTRFQYDSSIPTSGGLFPVPNNGCATTRPFAVEDAAELPVTLPRDGMLRFLGCKPEEIVRMWIECAELIARARGVVVVLTHCERRFSGTPSMLDAYRRLLDHLHDRPERFVFCSPTAALARLA